MDRLEKWPCCWRILGVMVLEKVTLPGFAATLTSPLPPTFTFKYQWITDFFVWKYLNCSKEKKLFRLPINKSIYKSIQGRGASGPLLELSGCIFCFCWDWGSPAGIAGDCAQRQLDRGHDNSGLLEQQSSISFGKENLQRYLDDDDAWMYVLYFFMWGTAY